MVRLSELDVGMEAKIVRTGDIRLMEMGFIPGVKVKALRKAPLGDPVEYEVRGYRISLRSRDADLVEVVL